MLPLLVTLLLAVIVLATAAWWIKTKSSVAIIEVAAPEQDDRRGAGGGMQAGLRRRRARRARGHASSDDEEQAYGEDGEDEQQEQHQPVVASKRQAYDAQRAQREAEREALEAAQEAEIAAAAAAREARDKAEAEKWRSMFTVEETGQEALTQEQGESLEGQIIEYIQTRKTVELDALAAEFGLKVADVIKKVQGLEAEQKLTGIMDDRGKFIYISRGELEAVAEAITSRGRIAIAELAQLSTRLIDLNPRVVEGEVSLDDVGLDGTEEAVAA
ncbi:hypothetical protein ACKKBG_A20200 [Auxenochlorella protothecoides x Auxenochlorella symbiontica]